MTPDYTGARAVVFGASGFVGRAVAAHLTRAGAEVHAVVRDRRTAEPVLAGAGAAGAIVHEANLRVTGSAARLVARLRPTIVFNMAGYGVDPEEKAGADAGAAARLNTELPAELAEAMAGAESAGWTGARLIQAGSVLEYGGVGGSLAEVGPERPTHWYGVAKLAGTRALRRVAHRAGLPAATARLAQLFGPGEHPGRLLPALIAARATGVLAPLSQGTQSKDFTYVADAAEGLVRLGLASLEPGEAINLATGRLTTVREFVLAAAHLLRLPERLLRFERPVSSHEPVHDPITIDRLRVLTQWSPPTTIAEGIRRTIGEP